MSPERKRRLIAELAPSDDRDRTTIDVRFLDNTTHYCGVDKAFVVSLQHIVYRQPTTPVPAQRSEGWAVRLISIDRYTGSGGVYDTLEQAQAVFDQHVERSSHEVALF